MSKSQATSQPAAPEVAEESEPAVEAAAPEAAAPENGEADAPEESTEADVPLNRAERRAKAKGLDPSHVGPRAGRTTPGRGGRSHTKRQLS